MKNILKTFATAIVALSALSCSCADNASAQIKDDSKPYNLSKAWEVLQNDHDEEQAMKLLKEQLGETPDNVECWMLLCRIHRNRDEHGAALSTVNEALKVNKPKKSGFYNSTLWWWKGSIYGNLHELEKAVECYKKALSFARKDNPKNVQEISFDLGQALYLLDCYDEADAVYSQMIKEDETDQAAMVGLARNMIARENFTEAIELLDECTKYDEDYASIYKFRWQAYDKIGETDKAIDDALTWYEKEEDAYGSAIVKILMKHRSYAIAKAKSMMKDSDNQSAWRLLLVDIYEASGEYENAISQYDALEEEYGKDEYLYYQRANCYSELGLTNKALTEIDKAIALENDYHNNCRKGQILRTAGRYQEAISAFDMAIELDPTDAFAYYAKGWCYELSGNDSTALLCYEQGIDLDKSYPYVYLMRGEIYLKKGDKEKADVDFETVLQMDTTAVDGSCRQYALFFLGRNDEAEDWMQKLIDDEPFNIGHYYNQACLYSRMGKLDDAIGALEKCLKMGYCQFAHIEHDDDLDAIRSREDFKTLIATYKTLLEERIEKLDASKLAEDEEQITEVAISRRAGGTFNVDCSVNGLALSMIFDTGASDVTISKVEADFMLKNNYLSKDDIKGKKYYQIADGGITEGTIVTLKEVKIGDAILHNVDASVVKNQKAPLLLGESVLQKFGTFTVDNVNEKLIIRH